jgi:hypothetical protein
MKNGGKMDETYLKCYQQMLLLQKIEQNNRVETIYVDLSFKTNPQMKC